MEEKGYDVIVVGGGPVGLACAIEVIKTHLKVIVLEKGALAESIRRYPNQMTFFSTAENIAIGDVPFTINKPKATREEALNYYRKAVEIWNVPITLYNKVTAVIKKDSRFRVDTENGQSFLSNFCIISTGYFDFPRKLNIPGENLDFVRHYYDEPYRYARQKVVISGGGNSAIEAALDLYRHGVKVTMIVRKDTLKPTAKYWLQPDIMNRIKAGDIEVLYNHELKSIEKGSVKAKDLINKKMVFVDADFVLILTGYLPDIKFLQQCGIQVDPESYSPTYNSNSYETNIENLYVAGTVTAGIHTEKVFIENGREHAKLIASDIQKKSKKVPQIN
jgi:thioredoxin reductase (NADPH)